MIGFGVGFPVREEELKECRCARCVKLATLTLKESLSVTKLIWLGLFLKSENFCLNTSTLS